VQGSKAMLKPAVIGSGVNEACQSKLLYISQTLKPGMLNNIKYQIARQADKSVNRIIYNFPFVGFVCHSENLWPTKLYKKNAFLL
jgi:hypothetical protein